MTCGYLSLNTCVMNFSKTYTDSVKIGADYHATHPKWTGLGTAQYQRQIEVLRDRYGVRTALDFGCGKGQQYSEQHFDKQVGIEVTQYDPCIHGLDKWPEGKWDMVWAFDCLPMVPQQDLPWLYGEMRSWATHVVLVAAQLGRPPKMSKQKAYSNVDISKKWQDMWCGGVEKWTAPKFHLINNFEEVGHPPSL
jgi:hypothetical protein